MTNAFVPGLAPVDSAPNARKEAARRTALHALERQIEQRKEQIEDLLCERNIYVERFNIFRKSLNILLDEDYLTMVISGDSVLDELIATCKLRKPNIHSDALSESFNGVQDAIKEHYPNLDLRSAYDKLQSVIHDSDMYYDKEESVVERSVDTFLQTQLPSDSDIADCSPDYLILLSSLDSF